LFACFASLAGPDRNTGTVRLETDPKAVENEL